MNKINNVIINMANSKSLRYLFAAFLSLTILSPNMGIKAEERAPSAKKALNKLGIAKAIKKISVNLLAPKKAAIVVSLKRPKILLKKTATLDL
jgi:hypothetical protein